MFSTSVRFSVIAIAVIVLVWTITSQVYEISALTGFFILYLVYGYFKEGTVVLAAKSYHKKDYGRAEELLKQIKSPDRLRKGRRGYYEFMYGNIELRRDNVNEAERHFQIASRFPFRNDNEKGLLLTQLANINLRKHEYSKAQAYIDRAKDLKISARVVNIIEKIENEIKKGSG